MNYPESFNWWRQRFQNNQFPYICPSCSTNVGIRQRVVQNRRRCPACGLVINIADIDEQLKGWESDRQDKMNSCLGALLLLVGTTVGFLALVY